MWGLYGLFGLFNQLLQRLTQTRSDNLDNLDDSITSRAPAATAISTANWPGTRQDFLNLIKQITGLNPSQLSVGAILSDSVDLWNKIGTGFQTFFVAISTSGTGSNSGANWETLFTTTGTGNISFLGVACSSVPTAPAFEVRVTVDGVQVLNTSINVGLNPGVDSKAGAVFVGGMSFSTTSPHDMCGIAYEDVRFLSDFTIEVKRNNVNTTLRAMYKFMLLQ